MHLSNQSLLVILVVGIVAGWLAGRVMAGVIMRGSPLYHKFKVILEELRKAWHTAKELGEELLNNDQRE